MGEGTSRKGARGRPNCNSEFTTLEDPLHPVHPLQCGMCCAPRGMDFRAAVSSHSQIHTYSPFSPRLAFPRGGFWCVVGRWTRCLAAGWLAKTIPGPFTAISILSQPFPPFPFRDFPVRSPCTAPLRLTGPRKAADHGMTISLPFPPSSLSLPFLYGLNHACKSSLRGVYLFI